MSTVLYRSDSPYIPRPIETPQQLLMPSAVPDAIRALRILIASCRSDPMIATEGMFVSEFAQALADLGHHVDVATSPPYPELNAHASLIELPGPPRSPRSPLNIIGRFSGTVGETAEAFLFGRRLTQFLRSRASHYDLLVNNQTLCWGLSKLKRMGTAVISIVHDPETPTRVMHRKVLRRVDHVLASSPAAFEELARNPEIDRRKLALIPRGSGNRGERAAAVLGAICAELPGHSAPPATAAS